MNVARPLRDRADLDATSGEAVDEAITGQVRDGGALADILLHRTQFCQKNHTQR
jgi:hypothetical protein